MILIFLGTILGMLDILEISPVEFPIIALANPFGLIFLEYSYFYYVIVTFCLIIRFIIKLTGK